MRILGTVLLGILVLVVISSAQAATIHVPGEQPTIQAGIDEAVNGDTVLVSDGTYTGAGNVNLDVGGKAITVKSENGAENCIIDCEGNVDTRGFYFHNGEGLDSVVDGFTIRNGNVIGDQPQSSNPVPCNRGAGIYCYFSSPTIINNIIMDNVGNGDGGGICCWESSPIIAGNIITRNLAGCGAGIVCHDNSSPLISNNSITDNITDGYGGGIYINGPPETTPNPVIINNTITGNQASHTGGGINCGGNCSITITNTILWNNSTEEIYFFDYLTPTVTISYSDIQGGQAGIVTNTSSTLDWGEGNINADPLFVNAANDDYHLQAGSPCIDAGTANGAPAYDIEGNPRDGTPDMGAYEGTGAMNQPPVADAGPDQFVEANTIEGANVQLDGSSSSDPDGDDLDYYWTWDSASATGVSSAIILPLGTTTVALTVDDGNGGTDTDTVDITVEDTTAPFILLGEPDPSVLWPPDHKFVNVAITGMALDICDADLDIDVSIEVIDADGGDGGTEQESDYEILDATIDEEGNVWISVSLRAERSGRGDGRVYEVEVVVTDGEGNEATEVVEVLVPRDQGKGKEK